MSSPWLDIPLSDYEGHMALPEVGQAQLLAEEFASLLATHRPRSVAVLGCAGGNGFERIDPGVTARVVGIELNPAYVAEARDRFASRLPGLELQVGNIESDRFAIAPVELVFAALVFEYVDPERALATARSLLQPRGRLVTVVQHSRPDRPDVTPSPFVSLQALAGVMRPVPPDWLRAVAALQAFRQTDRHAAFASGGRAFEVQTFQFVG